MDLLIGYDVDTTSPEGRRRLRRAAIVCKDYGQRVQRSVFECRVTPAQLESLEARLLKLIDPTTDSLRIYVFHGGRDGAVRVYGKDAYRDFDDPLIF